MKALLINGSPHANGCTFTALSIVAEELQKNGIETEIVHIGNKDIRGCIACGKCAEMGHCVFNDMVNEVAPKFEQADGLVVGSPVYYAGPNGTLTNLLDRFTISEMPIASSRYWNMVHGHTPEDVMKDEEGVQIMRILGRNMAFLMRAIAAERERNGLPEKEVTRYTNFIR